MRPLWNYVLAMEEYLFATEIYLRGVSTATILGPPPPPWLAETRF